MDLSEVGHNPSLSLRINLSVELVPSGAGASTPLPLTSAGAVMIASARTDVQDSVSEAMIGLTEIWSPRR
jgi:hypothetical protein